MLLSFPCMNKKRETYKEGTSHSSVYPYDYAKLMENTLWKTKTQRTTAASLCGVVSRACYWPWTRNHIKWREEKRANSAIFVQAISHTYLRSLSTEEEMRQRLSVSVVVTQREEHTKRRSDEEIAAIVCRERRLLCRALRTNRQRETEWESVAAAVVAVQISLSLHGQAK